MVISRKVNKPHHPSLIINNQQLEDVKYHKHLGVTISDDGSWNKHIELVIDKAYLFCLVLYVCTSWKRLGIKVDKDAGVKSFCILNSWMSLWFSLLSFNFDNRLSHEKLYLSFIRPLLEYVYVVWDPHNMYLINILEKVQIEAMRIISGGTKLELLVINN
jgi:hypothetical protein